VLQNAIYITNLCSLVVGRFRNVCLLIKNVRKEDLRSETKEGIFCTRKTSATSHQQQLYDDLIKAIKCGDPICNLHLFTNCALPELTLKEAFKPEQVGKAESSYLSLKSSCWWRHGSNATSFSPIECFRLWTARLGNYINFCCLSKSERTFNHLCRSLASFTLRSSRDLSCRDN